MARAEMQTDWLEPLTEAATDSSRVRGLTHSFYRYPARFSPQFAAAAIDLFSEPGDLILDPFMGGGTTIVEAYAMGRRAYGVDLNQLAAFVTRAKLTRLSKNEMGSFCSWIEQSLGAFDYGTRLATVGESGVENYTQNLSGPEARPVKKLLRFLLARVPELASQRTMRFARCVILRTSQWALDGRRSTPSISDFQDKALAFAEEMLCAMLQLHALVGSHEVRVPRPRVICGRAENLPRLPLFRDGEKATLAVTSPPYPGVHILYHRWQILGRRETAAPYWITDSRDGQGAAYYNFGDRKDPAQERYFKSYAASLGGIASSLKQGGVLVQMVACKNAAAHLPRIYAELELAGFDPLAGETPEQAITRSVPGRRWHAALQGDIDTTREFVLVHRRR